jgi:hypothetical protein
MLQLGRMTVKHTALISPTGTIPKSYEEYVSRIKALLALGIPSVSSPRRRRTSHDPEIPLLGIHQFILNDDKAGRKDQAGIPEVRLSLSITRL